MFLSKVTKFKVNYLSILVSIVLALVFSFTMLSCKELLDVRRTFTFSQEFTIADGENLSFSEFEVVDMTVAESLINEYGSKIKDIEIEELKYWLKAHQGPDGQTVTNFVLDVARADGSNVTNIVTLSNVALAGLLNNPTVATVNNGGIALASELIKTAPHKLKFLTSGNVNEGPISFTVVVDFKIKMTANPLNK
jgi:hypothetical protein